MPKSPLPSAAASISAPASVAKDHAPSPSVPSTSTVNGKSPVVAATSTAPAAARSPSPRQVKSCFYLQFFTFHFLLNILRLFHHHNLVVLNSFAMMYSCSRPVK
jgi:hypothetical protein